MRATDDQGENSRSNDVMISVSVNRDQEPPQFVGLPYYVQVSENRAVNSTVTQIVATDPDLQVSSLNIRGIHNDKSESVMLFQGIPWTVLNYVMGYKWQIKWSLASETSESTYLSIWLLSTDMVAQHS